MPPLSRCLLLLCIIRACPWEEKSHDGTARGKDDRCHTMRCTHTAEKYTWRAGHAPGRLAGKTTRTVGHAQVSYGKHSVRTWSDRPSPAAEVSGTTAGTGETCCCWNWAAVVDVYFLHVPDSVDQQ